ncbi:hypothetical protein EJ357_41520 [Streptomyces cyaneochromogenes]|uniref:Uncharacterized protein n=1 Tax=Streptomyces cyaneochromogenes TaxID=2496836 RepID=A0A3Q9ETW8_9ACTN|nr:hypothetical protein [Streptomyces cyaneochromogenes]AZQ39119.1 hypothetical protein EJ357_41520 [Streptomyces cyaneochromogenes]
MPGQRSISEAEKPAEAKLGGSPLHREQMAVVASIYRAASTVRQHLAGQLSDEECRSVAEGLRRVVLQVEEQGEERRLALLDGAEPAPRRSGRRPKA